MSNENDVKFKQIANGNEHAESFCRAFVDWCHMFDDVADKDKPVADEEMAVKQLNFFVHVSHNPFFQQNKRELTALIVQGVNAWLDANRWERSPEPEMRRDSWVMKSIYQEVVWHVAYLTGGWNHMRTVTMNFREYQHDGPKPEKKEA